MSEKDIEDWLEKNDDMYFKKIEDIKKDALEATRIDNHNIEGESIRTISFLHTYTTMLAEEKHRFQQIARRKKKIHAELYKKFKFEINEKLDSRGEIEEWINKSVKFQQVSNYYEHHQTLIKYIEGIIKVLENKRWTIRDIIEIRKIETG